MKTASLFMALLLIPAQQQPPATEIFLATLGTAGQIESWINISNHPEYDNQPSFLPDSSAVLFSSRRDGKQTDIYRYDIASRVLTQLTKTPEQEYSPLVTPDRRGFSTVRVEADNSQRLWRFDLDGSNPRLVLEHVKPVGYHAWIDETHLALFVLGSGGSPATLQIADTKSGTAEVVESGIGRSILMRPKSDTVSYMTTGQTRMIKEFNPKTRATNPIVTPLPNSQDAAWLPNGRLLMAAGAVLSEWDPAAADSGWRTRLDFGSATQAVSPRVGQITRLAVSPNGRWLAFVVQ